MHRIRWFYACKKNIDWLLLDTLFSPHDFDKNDQIILSYFRDASNRSNKIIRSNKIQIVRNKKNWELFYQWAFEAETESKWLSFFNKQGNWSSLEYIKEIKPNIQFQPDRIFIRNDLFERIIKSCKAANVEFLLLKEKLGICPYEENYYEEEIIKIQVDIEKTDKESTKKLIKELSKELDEESDKDSDKKSR